MTTRFREATDELFSGVDTETLAKALGCSVALINQARLREGAKARRAPPEGWEQAVSKIADQKAAKLMRLAKSLRRS
jgi:hypothetical protein